MSDEYQKVRLQAAHGPDTHFEGKLIHEFSTQNRDGTKDRWSELRLWETRGGAWIAESVGCSTRGNEREIREVAVIEPTFPDQTALQLAAVENDGWMTPEVVSAVTVEQEPTRRMEVMAAFGWTTAAKAFAREMGWNVVRVVE